MKLYTLILLLLCSVFVYGSDQKKKKIPCTFLKRKSVSPNTSHKVDIPLTTASRKSCNPLHKKCDKDSKQAVDKKPLEQLTYFKIPGLDENVYVTESEFKRYKQERDKSLIKRIIYSREIYISIFMRGKKIL